jgi:hypothetical protein
MRKQTGLKVAEAYSLSLKRRQNRRSRATRRRRRRRRKIVLGAASTARSVLKFNSVPLLAQILTSWTLSIVLFLYLKTTFRRLDCVSVLG